MCRDSMSLQKVLKVRIIYSAPFSNVEGLPPVKGSADRGGAKIKKSCRAARAVCI